MKKNIRTINEQIKRMTSLFTEERLYGNLVESEMIKEEGEEGQEEEATSDAFDVNLGKSKRLQKKDLKKTTSNEKQTNRENRKKRKELQKFCSFKVGQMVKTFYTKQLKLSGTRDGNTTWDDALKFKVPRKNIKNEVVQTWPNMSALMGDCSKNFNGKELNVDDNILKNLVSITDTSKDVTEREKLYLKSNKKGVKENVFKPIKMVFNNNSNVESGELILQGFKDGKYSYLIKPKGGFNIVGSQGIFDDFKNGIKTAVEKIYSESQRQGTFKTAPPQTINDFSQIKFLNNKKTLFSIG